MLIDARTVPDGREFACDLCIVGAGPAGIVIADRLRKTGLSIILIESGGFNPELRTQRLFRGENLGHAYFRLDACRFRRVGGGTTVWGGWCRPLDACDFERQDWVPWSGWPISEDTLKPYYGDVARICQLPNEDFGSEGALSEHSAPLPLDGLTFENGQIQFSGANFADIYRQMLTTDPAILTLLNANLTQIELDPDSNRVGALRVTTLEKRAFVVRPKEVVLAAGGIENARLLLSSNGDRPAGLGNQNDLVGRFFSEHLHVAAGHLVSATSIGDLSFYRRNTHDGMDARGVILPTGAAQRLHRLLPTSIVLEPSSYVLTSQRFNWTTPISFAAIRAYRRAQAGPLKPALESMRNIVDQLAGIPKRYETWNTARAARSRANSTTDLKHISSLYFRAGQVPDPESRVTLSRRRDALGVPETRLNWRVNQFDIASINSWLHILHEEVSAKSIGQVILPVEGWQNDVIGGRHHMGTTRMSSHASAGVVDENCRVHSVANLYIAGSSVFTTGGHANPTFTLLALALRLADTLRHRFSSQSSYTLMETADATRE